MSETMAETVLTRRSSAESRSQDTSTMSEALSAENSAGTTDEPTTDTRVLDLDAAKPAAIDGATAIFVPAYERVSGALRYDGDVVTHLIGVYSRGDARNALADNYSSAEITQAFERGAWMEREHMANANEAIAAVESSEVATDGGVAAKPIPNNAAVGESATATDHDGIWKDEFGAGCETCGDETTIDRKAARLPDGHVAHVCPSCFATLPSAGESSRRGYPASELESAR